MIWGFAFVAQRAGMEFVGPLTFTGARFALGSLVFIPFIRTSRRSATEPRPTVASHHLWIAVGLSGLVLLASANLQQIGWSIRRPARLGSAWGNVVDAWVHRMCSHAGWHDAGSGLRSSKFPIR
ncbi:EamA family transporter [Candidatus Bipolaricaulota bacterium]